MPRSSGLEPPGEGGGAAGRLRQFEQSRGFPPSGAERDDDEREPAGQESEGHGPDETGEDGPSAQQRDTEQRGQHDQVPPEREDGDA